MRCQFTLGDDGEVGPLPRNLRINGKVTGVRDQEMRLAMSQQGTLTNGSVAIVTGGARGVGQGITMALLGAGAEVLICGRTEPTHAAVVDGPDGIERATVFVSGDVRDAEQASSIVAEAKTRFGRLDLLVNNAGGTPISKASEASARFIEKVVALNLLAPFYCAQAANAIMQEQDSGGQIINIGSIAGMRASPGTTSYGAAKVGLINLTETLAVEWAPKVRVNCISAGLLDSGAGADHYGGEEALAKVAATIPMGRMGTPQDVADVVLSLASSSSTFLTGANVVLHGGGEWPSYQLVQGNRYQ